MMANTAGPTVTERALSILAAFSADRPALTLSEISRRTGLPLTTTHRLTRELTRWGALEQDEAGRHHIGLRLWEVGALARRGVGLREAALPFLEDLYEATHENIQLAVLDGTDAVYVDRISGRKAVHVVTRAGSRLPVHATGVGLVLLAHAPVAILDRVLAGPLKRYTAHTITDHAQLRRVLADVRQSGYVISDRQIELVSISVAAPVYGSLRTVVAALSIVIPAKGTDAQRYVPAVRATAHGISRALGAPTVDPY
jgi:DNA-binding IclR family transcriptional regulator